MASTDHNATISGRDTTVLRMTGEFCARHSAAVIGTWLAVLVGAALFIPAFLSGLTGPSLMVPGSSSARAEQVIADKFSKAPAERAVLVFDSQRSTMDLPNYHAAVQSATSAAEKLPDVVAVHTPGPRTPIPTISSDSRTALAIVDLRGSERDRQQASARLQHVAKTSARNDVSVYFTGTSALTRTITERQMVDILRAEAIGVPIALLVLLIAFRTVVSSLVPLIMGFTGIGVVFGVLGALSGLLSFDVLVESIVTMIGLAIGIDYSLLLVTRYRAIRSRRPDAPPSDREGAVEAIGTTMRTAGRAALFSGVTVLVSLVGLFLIRGLVFRDLAIAVLCTVAVMLLVTLTLLPAVLHRLDGKLEAGRLGRRDRPSVAPTGARRWERWAHWVTRRAIPVAGLAIAVLTVLASPLAGLTLGFDSGVRSLTGEPAATGYTVAGKKFSPGYASTMFITIRGRTPLTTNANLTALRHLTGQLTADRRVAATTSLTSVLGDKATSGASAADINALPRPVRNQIPSVLNVAKGANTTIISVTLNTAPDDPTAVSFTRDLSDHVLPKALRGTDLHADVGGLSAQIADLETEVKSKTPMVIALVLGLSFLLLAVAFRSVLLPIKAILMNLLAVGSAGGLLVWAFQEGNLSSLLDFPVVSSIQVYLPLLAFAILFGLSMDYEVFMVTRMREIWDEGNDNQTAVARGLADTGRIVTAASLIMFVVFAAAVATRVLQLKEIGFALAVAILLDATLVRLMLVPALMRLFGKWNWWAPWRRQPKRTSQW